LLDQYTIEDAKRIVLECEKVRLERSLYEFVSEAWPHMGEPVDFIDSWAIEAVCDHLQAVVDGYIPNLLVNIPPRMSKTTVCSVMFPAWVWAQRDHGPLLGPGVRFLCSSYGLSLAEDASKKCRMLVKSDWYQERWGDRFNIMADMDTVLKWGNDKGGLRECVSVGSGTTGKGGAILIADDINMVQDGESAAAETASRDWWDTAYYNRLNDTRPGRGARIVIQQRISRRDISEHLLEGPIEWTHLMLPMRFEPHRSPTTVLVPAWATEDGQPVIWADPRKDEGELLWPERFPEASVKEAEATMGPAKAAGQLQQSPVVAGGGIIERLWWQPWEHEKLPPMDFRIMSVDPAFGEKQTNDFTAITVWGIWRDSGVATGMIGMDMATGSRQNVLIHKSDREAEVPKVIMMYARQGRWALHDAVTNIGELAKEFKIDVLLIENKASGISISQEIRRIFGYEDFSVRLEDPGRVDKVARTYAIQHLFSEGLIYAPETYAWAQMVITQAEEFPKSKHDDLHDSMVQALNWLRKTGMIQRAAERTAELADITSFRGNKGAEPLYPV